MEKTFVYNGFLVKAIGPAIAVAGGVVQRVEIIDPPHYIADVRFNAVVG